MKAKTNCHCIHDCMKIIMTCTVSISMHTNNLTSVGWSMCMCTVSKKNNYSVSPLDWLQVAMETYHRSQNISCKKYYFIVKNLAVFNFHGWTTLALYVCIDK